MTHAPHDQLDDEPELPEDGADEVVTDDAGELDAALATCLAASATPRIQAAIASIDKHVDEILRGGPRGVAVANLPRLYLDPAPFRHAPGILEQHEAVVGGMRHNLQNLLKGIL